jgi:hypothetical protein
MHQAPDVDLAQLLRQPLLLHRRRADDAQRIFIILDWWTDHCALSPQVTRRASVVA